ncbi:MAG: GntR family transcriptional regulator [Eubacteriales bacterium]|nr:GntR family transcriptional regulator [Eubacteriales bacterium]
MDVLRENSNNPLYIQIRDAIQSDIEDGILNPGDKIPSETILQKRYCVSRVTIRKAIDLLVESDDIVRIHGKGMYVSQVKEFRKKEETTGFTKLCKMQGKASISQVIGANMRKSTEEQMEFFHLSNEEEVLFLERVRKVDGIPFIIETNFFHPSCRFLLEEDLSGSIYDVLERKYHIIPKNIGKNEVIISHANEYQAKILRVKVGTVVIVNHAFVYDNENHPLHVVEQVVRVDRPEDFVYYLGK